MKALGKVVLTFGLAALVTLPAVAQQQQRGGRGFGGRGGFGGFGGPGMLLQNEGVKKELKLTDEQAKKASEAVTKVREKHQDEFQGLRDLSQDERREKMTQITKVISDETTKALADILTPEQQKRLKQIQLQQRGPQAFSDPDVLKALKLTDDQKEAIKTINEDFTQDSRELFQSFGRGNRGAGRGLGGAGGFSPENQKKITELRKETMGKVMAVLKDDQKKTWKEMTGDPFEVRFEGQRGGRGGDGNQGQGQRRGRRGGNNNQNQNNQNQGGN